MEPKDRLKPGLRRRQRQEPLTPLPCSVGWLHPPSVDSHPQLTGRCMAIPETSGWVKGSPQRRASGDFRRSSGALSRTQR